MNPETVNYHNKIENARHSNWYIIELTFLARTWGDIQSTFTAKEVCDVIAEYLDVPESQVRGLQAEVDQVLPGRSVLAKIRTDSDRLLGVVDPYVEEEDREYFFICLELN